MAKRVLVERLRPQTQQEVVVRPVDTYIQPPQVQEGSLQDLARFIDRIQPTVGRLAAERERQLAEEDIKKARKLAETTSQTYNELVQAGEIGPEESPVFRYAFNETRGEAAGYTFIQEASEAYTRGNIAGATDASGFDDWYQEYYSNYVENNQDILGADGAYDQFSRVANQARNNLLNTHLSNVKKNFAAAQATAYENFVFGALDTADLSTPEGQAALRDTFNIKQKDLAGSGGPEYSFSKLNNSTVDSVIAYYASKDYDIVGLENTLNTLQGGTGPLGGTSYARQEIAKARVTFAKERLAAEKREEDYRNINEARTKDNVNQIFYGEFMKKNYDVDAIYESLDPETQQQIATFYPEGLAGLYSQAEKFQTARVTEPMAPAAVADIRQELERIPADKRVERVIQLTQQGRISDNGVYKQMMSFATSSRDSAANGGQPDATKDPIYKDFFEKEFELRADKYIDENGAKRQYFFQVSFYELFDELDEEGNRTWDTYSPARKLQLLNGIMNEVNAALNETDQTLLGNTSNTLTPVLGPDGKPLIVNGNPVFEQNTMN
jgi:hypothetical protein